MRMKKGFIALEINSGRRSNLKLKIAGDRSLRGFTLLEIVIALTIFAIGLVGFLSLFPVAFHSSKRASDLTEATVYAQKKIEELKRDGYDNLPPNGTTGNFDSRFSWQIDRTNLSTGLDEIKLTVIWKEGGKDFSEEFVTYIARLNP